MYVPLDALLPCRSRFRQISYNYNPCSRMHQGLIIIKEMAQTRYLRNTLYKHKLYTFKASSLHHHILQYQVVLSNTSTITGGREGPNLLCVILSLAINRANSLPHQLLALLLTSICSYRLYHEVEVSM